MSRRTPTVWALTGGRAGDDAQVLALAEAVGETTAKRLAHGPLYRVPNALLGPTLASVDIGASDRLDAPWPDVVIGAGRRSVPAALWIRRQSGARARLVRIGRPRAPLAWFDLVLTTPQYGLPDAPNVLRLMLPPVRITPPKDDGLADWSGRLAHLPRPWIGVLVGGTRWPYRLDGVAAATLAGQARAAAGPLGGSLLISTSPRTGGEATRVIANSLKQPFELFAWSPGGENAHQAILALADRFIVTGESVSMLTEACLTGRPVQIFPLPRRWQPHWRSDAGVGRWLVEAGLLSPPRDPDKVATLLVERGHASLLKNSGPRSHTPVPDELARAAEAVRRLLDA